MQRGLVVVDVSFRLMERSLAAVENSFVFLS